MRRSKIMSISDTGSLYKFTTTRQFLHTGYIEIGLGFVANVKIFQTRRRIEEIKAASHLMK